MIFLAAGKNFPEPLTARRNFLAGNLVCVEVAARLMTGVLPAGWVVAQGSKGIKHQFVSGRRLLPGKISPAGFFAQPATINNYDHDQKK